MRIILSLIYFIIFLAMAFAAMFLGGVFGVAGTFYLMVEPGDLEANLTKAMAALGLLWLLVIILRRHNKKIIKRNLKLKAAEAEASES